MTSNLVAVKSLGMEKAVDQAHLAYEAVGYIVGRT